MLQTWHIYHKTHTDDCPLCDEVLSKIATLESELFDDGWSQAMIQDSLSQFGASLIYMTDEMGVLIGYCVYSRIFEMAEILRIGTSQKYQSQGVGRVLMTNIIHQCEQNAVERILLEVRADNIPAIALYHKMGFVQISTRHNYYHTNLGNVDACILQCTLSV